MTEPGQQSPNGQSPKGRLPKDPLSPQQADLLLGHLASGVADGMPLAELFRAMADDITDSRLQRVAAYLTVQLDQGVDLATALASMRPLLPEHMKQALLLGVASGHLPAVMSALAKSERTRNRMRRGLRAVLAYPLLAAGMLLLLVLFVSVVVIPEFADMCQDIGLDLTVITQAVLALSAALPKILAVLLAIGLAPFVLGRMTLGKWFTHRIRTAVPLLGRAWQWAGQHEFATFMAALTREKIPITETLDCTAGLLRDRNMARATRLARTKCEKGALLSQCLGKSIHFEPTLTSLVAWGEKAQAVPEAFEEAARTYEQQMEAYLRFLSHVVPPAMILIVALTLLLLIGALLWTLGDLISGLMF